MKDKSKLAWRLITIAVVIFLLSSGVYFLISSTSETKRLEQDVNDRFGMAEQFVPEADGAVPADRLERFVRVRRAVHPACMELQQVMDGILGMASIEDDPDLPGDEAARRGITGMKSAIKAGSSMVRLMDARNSSLLEQGMGLGEYIYLYLAAYSDQLADVASSPYAELEESRVSNRTRTEFIRILTNQLDALGSGAEAEIRVALEEEIQSLKESKVSTPWPNGPLPKTRESLSPYRDELNGLYCDGVVAIELLQKNRGFSFGG